MFETLSRRGLVGCIAGLLGAGLGGSTLLTAGTGPVVAVSGDATSFDAADAPTVERNDGRIEAVYVRPEIDVNWEDFGSGVDSIGIEVAVAGDTGIDELYDERLSDSTDLAEPPGEITDVEGDGFGAVDGALTATFERADLTARGDDVTSGALSDESLDAGEVAETTLELLLRADVQGNEGERETVVETATFDVAVHNPEGSADAGGEANTDAA